MRNLLIIAVIGILLFGCVNPPQSGGNQSPSQSVMTAPNATLPSGNASNGTGALPSNGTAQNGSASVLPSDYSVNLGDYVSVIYSLHIDGELYDTNNATLANESGKYNPNRRYVPLGFTAQIGAGMIDGFVINVVGMRLNETVSFDVDPARGYGPYDPEKVISVARYYTKNTSEVVPRSYFTERNLEVSNGTTYQSPFGPVFIQGFDDENVTLFYSSLMISSFNFTYMGIPNQVVYASAENATIERAMNVNATYVVPDPQTGQATRFRVLGKDNETITLDANHELANKTLHFTVTLLDVVPAPHD